MKSEANRLSRTGSLDTLAQNDTTSTEYFSGTGCNVSTDEVRERRGKTKFIGSKVALALVDVAKEEGDLEFVQKAFNTFHCMSKVKYKNGLMFGKYCKNRFCPTCLGIRKANLINKYKPFISQWHKPYFVTLTTKACKAKDLDSMISLQKKAFTLIINRNKIKVRRNKARPIVCLRCHECNFNPTKQTYNPHFHLIVPDFKTAHYLAFEWQATINKLAGYKIANNAGQDFFRIKNIETHLIETIKYGTKIFTEKDATSEIANDCKLYVKAFYNILKAFEGKRLLSTFGFILPTEVVNKTSVITQVKNPSSLTYLMNECDWVNPDTGSMLTGYQPSPYLIELLDTVNLEAC